MKLHSTLRSYHFIGSLDTRRLRYFETAYLSANGAECNSLGQRPRIRENEIFGGLKAEIKRPTHANLVVFHHHFALSALNGI
jgi:hypothetical protein